MAKLYVGNLPPGIPEFELEREFARFGRCKVWVARKPPGFGFVEYDDPRDGDDAMRAMDGFQGWRVEFSRGPRGYGPPPPVPRFYGEPGPGGGFRRSPPAYHALPSYPRYRSPSPFRGGGRDHSYSPDQRRSSRYHSKSRSTVSSRGRRSRSRSRGRRDRSYDRRDQRCRSPSPKRHRSSSRSDAEHKRSNSRRRSNNHSPSPAAEDAAVTAEPAAGASPASSDGRRSRSPSPYSEASDRSKRSRSPSPP